MGTESPLGFEKIMAFVATQDAAKAKAFYRDTLGLRLMSEDHFALAFDAHGIMLRVTNVGKAVVAPYTVLGWEVKNITATVKAMLKALRGSLADGAKLDIVTEPAEAHCLSCFELVTVSDRLSPCPKCGGTELQISGGDALRIRELEVA